MSGSGLDKARMRTLGEAKADRAKAQKARMCLDCPGVNSLMCCGRARQAVPQEAPRV